MIVAAALLAILCALAAAQDIFRRRAHFGDLLFVRETTPRSYWLLVALWGLCIIGCAGVIADEFAKRQAHPARVPVVLIIPEKS